VLLLREGSARGGSSVEVTWLEQLRDAIKAIEAWGRRQDQKRAIDDAIFFDSLYKEQCGDKLTQGDFIKLVEKMASGVALLREEDAKREDAEPQGGLILVFDQFEEQLRPGAATQREAFRLIGELFASSAPVRVLLSMRREFRFALRDLEILIGELGRSAIYLRRLHSPSVVQAIESVSNVADISIEKRVGKRIVGWLTPVEVKEAKKRVGDRTEGNWDEAAVNDRDDESPDLLKLQAVLVELCRWAMQRGATRVTKSLFDTFVAELIGGSGNALGLAGKSPRQRKKGVLEDKSVNGDVGEETSVGQKVLGGALERWIESAIGGEVRDLDEEPFSAAGAVTTIASPYIGLSRLEADELRVQVRRIAVRLAPLLSSADYKIAQEENALFQQALGDEIAKLGLQDPRRLSKIEIIEGPEKDCLRLDWQALGGLRDVGNEGTWGILSGASRRGRRSCDPDWTPEKTGDRILACFKEALTRLSKANILRKTQANYGEKRRSYWELVHDQFGPNLLRWAEMQKGTWEDCLGSLVVCRGVQPLAVPIHEIRPEEGADYYEVDSVSWQGCGVEQAWSEKLVFRNVRFKDCFLVGTIFDGIDFIGCSFEDCILKGALFRNCNFLVDKQQKKATVFKRCHSNVAIVGGKIDGLEFEDCQLNQPAIKGVTLSGRVVYSQGSKVVQGLFENIKISPGADVYIQVKSDSSAAYCLTSKKFADLLRVEKEDPKRPNTWLPEELGTRN
jgi:hypothetical protein